jgi:hypothetical protein
MSTDITLFSDYTLAYNTYMPSLIKDIYDIEIDLSNSSHDNSLYNTVSNYLKLLKQKKLDYEYIHNLIIANPSKYRNIMQNFLDNI